MMIARGFRPVAWVGAIALAALCCYMLSLKVAAERAELAALEGRILRARQDIRTLQTELGTRGRLQQLEQWNADVLALSAPVAGQFVASNVSLAPFDVRAPVLQPDQPVQLASSQPAPAAPAITAAPRQASLTQGAVAGQASAPTVRRASVTQTAPARSLAETAPVVRRASLTTREVPAAASSRRTEPAARRRDSLLDQATLGDLSRASRAERRTARD